MAIMASEQQPLFSGRVATAVESELAVNPDQNSADWSVTIAADNISGTADIYVATYNQNNKLSAFHRSN